MILVRMACYRLFSLSFLWHEEFTNSINNDYQKSHSILTQISQILNLEKNSWEIIDRKLNILWEKQCKAQRKLWRHSWRVTVNSNNISAAGNTLSEMCETWSKNTLSRLWDSYFFIQQRVTLLNVCVVFLCVFLWFVHLEILAKK